MPPLRPASRLLLALILGTGLLTACGGEDSATLVKEAKTNLAAGEFKAAMIHLKNAIDLGLEPGHTGPQPLNLRQARENAERQAITRALAKSDNSVAQAAELLGITRPTLYDLMAKIGLK